MSLAFSLGVRVIPFCGDQQHMNMNMMATNLSSLTIKCSHTTPTNLIGKIKDKCSNLKLGDKSAVAPETFLDIDDDDDVPSNLRLIDTLERLGVDRCFRYEVDTILDHTYELWQQKDREIYSDAGTLAMAFRLLRVKGYQVSSEELAPYADHDRVITTIDDAATVLELYRASHERMYEEETTLEKLHSWTSTFLKQQLLTNSIHDMKLHKQVEFYLKNYHGILERVEVRRNLELYDEHYQGADHDLVAFARQDFNICQTQNQKELEKLQRWYADCRLDTLKFGRETVAISSFIASAVIGDPGLADARLVFTQHIVLTTIIDDFFDHAGSRDELDELLELVKDWKEKPSGEYGSKEVEILFTAVYSTVNELAEKAEVEQGRSVKGYLIKLWVEAISLFETELEAWSEDTTTTFDEYMSFASESILCKICILMPLQFVGVKLSDEMLGSEECADLCRYVLMVDRLLNDVGSIEREREERKANSVSILVAAAERDGMVVSEEEVCAEIKEMAEHNRRKLMQIVYERGIIFPRICKDVFLNVARLGYYFYWGGSGDLFSSPRQQIMDDMESLLYQPFTLSN